MSQKVFSIFVLRFPRTCNSASDVLHSVYNISLDRVCSVLKVFKSSPSLCSVACDGKDLLGRWIFIG